MEEIQLPFASNYFCRKDGTIFNRKTGNVITGAKHGNGYLTLYVRHDDGKRVKHYMHRLIAYAFLENPHNLPEIDHKNGKRNDNRLENLEWVTGSENTQRGYDMFNYRRHKRTDYSYQTI